MVGVGVGFDKIFINCLFFNWFCIIITGTCLIIFVALFFWTRHIITEVCLIFHWSLPYLCYCLYCQFIFFYIRNAWNIYIKYLFHEGLPTLSLTLDRHLNLNPKKFVNSRFKTSSYEQEIKVISVVWTEKIKNTPDWSSDKPLNKIWIWWQFY